jgi:hypothetical protein
VADVFIGFIIDRPGELRHFIRCDEAAPLGFAKALDPRSGVCQIEGYQAPFAPQFVHFSHDFKQPIRRIGGFATDLGVQAGQVVGRDR